MNEYLVDETVKRYIREYDRYKKLTEIVSNLCLTIVQKNLTIRATVQHRTKTPTSLAEKIRKSTKYKSIDNVFNEMNDLAGVRIIIYQEADRRKVVEEIQRVFIGKNNEKVKIKIKDKDGSEGKYYKATHCLVVLSPEYIVDNFSLKNTPCEIQICSLLSHVYNEIEHDLQYKPRTGSLSSKEKRLIKQLGLITKTGDIIIRKLLEATNERLKFHTGEFLDVHDFTIRMGNLLKIGDLFSNNAGLLYDEIINLKLDSPEIIISTLLDREENLVEVANQEYEKILEFMNRRNINIIIDRNSSDLLLLVLLRRKSSLIFNNDFLISKRDHSSRLLEIAFTYKEMIAEFENLENCQ